MPPELTERMLAAYGRFHAAAVVMLIALSLPWIWRRPAAGSSVRRATAWWLLVAILVAAALPVASTIEQRGIDREMAQSMLIGTGIDMDLTAAQAHELSDALDSPWHPLFAGSRARVVILERETLSTEWRPENWGRLTVNALVVIATCVGLLRWRPTARAPRSFVAATASATLLVAASLVWWNAELQTRATSGEMVAAIRLLVERPSR
jgi:hypothetical protein